MHQAQALMCSLWLARPCFPASCSAQVALPHPFCQGLRLQQVLMQALQCDSTCCQAHSLQCPQAFQCNTM